MTEFHQALITEVNQLRSLERLALEQAHDSPDAVVCVQDARQLLERLSVREGVRRKSAERTLG